MKERVSRRNGRTDLIHTLPISHLVLCGISLIVFLGGASTLSWAVSHYDPPPDDPQPQHSASRLEPSDGKISSSLSEPSDDSDSDANPHGAIDPETEDQKELDGEPVLSDSFDEASAHPTSPSVSQPSASTDSSSNSNAASSPASESQQSYVIHHTAAREEKTYKTVHHQASTAREVTVGGVARIEWTSCPVCGGRHDKAYNERVVDHVTRVGCTACGAFHDSSYDETVWN